MIKIEEDFIKKSKNKKKLSLGNFIQRSNKIHNNKFDYSKVVYINNHTKVCIICSKHGEFWQRPDHHLNGCGCSECKKDKISNSNTKSIKSFRDDAITIFGDKYDYSEVKYFNSKEKVKIICSEHGEFWQRPNDHLMGHGCPKCNQSRGERVIENWLNRNKIDFIYQKKFDDCKNIFELSFDFYLTDYNICVEYDGEQHFKPICFSRINYVKALLEFRKNQERDKIKNTYCFNNNINIMRIPYWEFKNINKILSLKLLGD